MTKLLIADDLDLSRKRLAGLLRRQGYQVLEAEDGDEALRIMKAERPDLAIIDLLMPAMDGFEFVREVRDDATIAQTPVIFVSAYFSADDVTALARALGVRHILEKSCSPGQILDAVREADSTLTPPSVSVTPTEFTQEHFRLITEKLTEQMKRFVTALGEYLNAGEAPTQAEPPVIPDNAGGPAGSESDGKGGG
jgi:diguanylate cyclase